MPTKLRTFKVRQIRRLAALSLFLGIAGCLNPSTPSANPGAQATDRATPAGSPIVGERPLVVATNTVVCDLTRQIAADTVNLNCLVAPGQDPHGYAPKPDDRKAIEQAKLILYGGYDFEPELIKLIESTSNPASKVAVDELAVPNPQQFEEDGKRENDPHVFHNAQNGALMAAVISKSLTQLEPKQAALYEANTKKLMGELTQLHGWIKSEIGTIPPAQRKLVTTHEAFGYYSKA
ncbi:MAG: zinc ABC transporter substrate-binding protein, partial [Kovacikia sp.]